MLNAVRMKCFPNQLILIVDYNNFEEMIVFYLKEIIFGLATFAFVV